SVPCRLLVFVTRVDHAGRNGIDALDRAFSFVTEVSDGARERYDEVADGGARKAGRVVERRIDIRFAELAKRDLAVAVAGARGRVVGGRFFVESDQGRLGVVARLQAVVVEVIAVGGELTHVGLVVRDDDALGRNAVFFGGMAVGVARLRFESPPKRFRDRLR